MTKILAVDDDSDNLAILTSMVQNAMPNSVVFMTTDPLRGIELAGTEDPDVILLDVVMPTMDGFEFCRRLKADEAMRSIPVVFITGMRTDREHRIKALEVGAEGFLSKPANEEELVAQIRAMAKIKAAGRMQQAEKDRLALLVADRTRKLEQELEEHRRTQAEKDKLQMQFVQAQKMESVGRLAGGVAHDFNNLLMCIMGYTQLCMEKTTPDNPIYEWLGEIASQAERSAHLSHQLLAFARKQTITPEILDLNDVVGRMLKLLRRLIGEDISISWHPGSNVSMVKVDPVQIDQILANLAVNARDAISGVGTIKMATSNVNLDDNYCAQHSGAAPGSYVLLTMSDSGCGMDKETLSHIFEPFFTTKSADKGTGLGLATVYGIIKQNSGHIEVSSEPGKGTTFSIYIPSFAAEDPVRIQETSKKAPRGTETILLVDDEKSVRTTSQLFLEDLGYRVLPATSAKEALSLAANHQDKIELLITDVIMPDMSGRDLAQRLAELRPAVKTLFISGFTADVIIQRGIQDDGAHFLSKPFTREQLAVRVRSLLDS